MHLTLLKSKVHRATVTGASLHYEGSLTISRDLAERINEPQLFVFGAGAKLITRGEEPPRLGAGIASAALQRAGHHAGAQSRKAHSPTAAAVADLGSVDR